MANFICDIVDGVANVTYSFDSKAMKKKQDEDEKNNYRNNHYKKTEDLENSENFHIDMDTFPELLILKIFSYLPMECRQLSVSRVCRKWQKLCKDPSLWRRIQFYGKYVYVTDAVLMDLFTRSTNFTCLSLHQAQFPNATQKGLQRIFRKCGKLQGIDLSSCKIACEPLRDVVLETIVKDCPDLIELVLDCNDFTDFTLMPFAEHGHKNLKNISMCQSFDITDKGIAAVIRGCPKLQMLQLSQNPGLTGEFMKEFNNSGNKTLQMLDLMLTKVKETHFPELGCLRYLLHLNVSSCPRMKIHHILPVFENCPDMEVLSLSLGSTVDDSWIYMFAPRLKKLMRLYLVSTAISDQGVFFLSQNCRDLEQLDLGYTPVSHVAVKHIAENCPKIEYIGLIRCKNVDEDAIEELAKKYPKIRFSTFIQDTKRMLIEAGCPIKPGMKIAIKNPGNWCQKSE